MKIDLKKYSLSAKAVIHQTWFYVFLLSVGFIAYLGQSIYLAFHLNTTMDEGTYLIKGLYLIRGDYLLFQDYGFWMNKMPFAFLFPGAAQWLFTPGLRTGRFFSILLNMGMITGLWLAARNTAGKGWALALVWVSALNSSLITYYIAATSQVQSAVFLVWALVLLLGKNKRTWQILLGVLFSCIVVLIRQNMIILLPIVILYIFWKYGKKTGIYAFLLIGFTLGGFHLIYWPNGMRIWAPWMPASLSNQLLGDSFLKGSISQNVNPVDLGFLSRVFAFVESYRIHFFLLVGTILSLIYWAPRKRWSFDTQFKDAVFTGGLFLILAVMHLWASIFQDACVFCYSGYLAFFSPAGLIFVALALNSALRKASPARQFLGILALAGVFFGFGYASYRDLLNWVVTLPFFRIKNQQILPGKAEIWRLLHNKFGWSFDVLERALPAFFALGIFIILILLLGIWVRRHKNQKINSSYGWTVGVTCLLLGTVISIFPTPAGNRNELVCQENVLQGYEQVGQTLQRFVPADSLVYWENQSSPVPLLYIQPVRIFPAQMNQEFNRLTNGDSQLLNRYGYWNDELAKKWRQEADYLLLEENNLAALEASGEFGNDFHQIGVTQPIAACRPDSAIYVYQRDK
jgi:hypothetical protein